MAVTVAPSFNDLLTQGIAEAQARRSQLVFLDGDYADAMLHAGAAMADTTIRYASMKFRDTFLDGATEAALDTLVADRYGLTRKPASVAQVTVTFTRGTTLTAGTIAAGTQVATAFDTQGKQVVFTTNTLLSIGIGVATASVLCTSTATGKDVRAAAGTVTQLLGALFDTFTCTNAAASAGGNDEESDAALRLRARTFYQTLRRGTKAAIEYGAKLVSTVAIATCVEDLTTGLVSIRVGDSSGMSTLQMVAEVATEIENWRAAGVLVQVIGAAPTTANITVVIAAFRAGFSVSGAAATITAAVSTRIGKLGVGEPLYIDMLVAAVISVAPDDILDVTVTISGGTPDLVPSLGNVIRVGTVTVA